MAQRKAFQMEPSDLGGLQMGMPASLFHLVYLDPQLLLIGRKAQLLFKQQMGLWPLHLALKITFGTG